jgi:hypothetical protein
LANFLQRLASHAKNVPKYLPEHLFSSSAWTNSGVGGRLDRRAENMEPSADSKDTEQKGEKQEKSYLSAAVGNISPWSSSRSTTPRPKDKSDKDAVPGEGSGLKNQHGGDHSSSYWRGLSKKRYPSDCPELNARWFHAVDVSLLNSWFG